MLERNRIRRAHLAANDLYMRRLMMYEPKVTSWVYFIQAGDDGPIKIGTSRDPRKRFLELQTASPYPLHVRAIGPGGRAAEHRMHTRFAGCRLHGEWFEPVPAIQRIVDQLNAFDRDLDLIAAAVSR
jgi:hypothetical protein